MVSVTGAAELEKMMGTFKFKLDQSITDKDVVDVRQVAGRMLDADNFNAPTYVLMKNGRIEILTAKMVEENFKEVEAGQEHQITHVTDDI